MIEILDDDSLPVPEPVIDTDTAGYFAAAREGRLMIGRCNSCAAPIWYPRPMCPECHSFDTGLEEASGRGRIYTFAVIRRAAAPYNNLPPFVLAYVELEEGPRVMTNVVDCDPDSLEIGQEVAAVFHRSAKGECLLRFRAL
jgi:uncharacterized protein